MSAVRRAFGTHDERRRGEQRFQIFHRDIKVGRRVEDMRVSDATQKLINTWPRQSPGSVAGGQVVQYRASTCVLPCLVSASMDELGLSGMAVYQLEQGIAVVESHPRPQTPSLGAPCSPYSGVFPRRPRYVRRARSTTDRRDDCAFAASPLAARSSSSLMSSVVLMNKNMSPDA